jgi:hypothetical protein
MVVLLNSCASSEGASQQRYVRPIELKTDDPISSRIVSSLSVDNRQELVINGMVDLWRCRPFGRPRTDRVVLEVGILKEDVPGWPRGYVLLDGSNSGITANYSRIGLDHRWNYNLVLNDSTEVLGKFKYSVLITHEDIGYFLDFSAKDEVRASVRAQLQCNYIENIPYEIKYTNN